MHHEIGAGAPERDFQVQAFPFRMTAENLARYRNDPNMPFWLMLKDGYDHFEVTGQPPKVDVCDRRYVFDAVAGDGRTFNALAACPPMSMPESLGMALRDKEAKDRAEILALAERLDRREATAGAASMRLAFAGPASAEHAALLPMSVAVGAVSLDAPRPDNPVREVITETAPTATTPASLEPAASLVATPAPAEETVPAAPSFLPVPDVASEADGQRSAEPPVAATLQERMLVGSEQTDASVDESYASASEEDEALSGILLRFKKR